MNACLIDTHTLIWMLADPTRLSSAARELIELCFSDADSRLYISTISIIELIYLVEKRRIPKQLLETITAAMEDGSLKVIPVDLTLPIALELGRIDRNQIPDMPDRIIAASAIHLAIPLVTKDAKIRSSSVTTVW